MLKKHLSNLIFESSYVFSATPEKQSELDSPKVRSAETEVEYIKSASKPDDKSEVNYMKNECMEQEYPENADQEGGRTTLVRKYHYDLLNNWSKL